MSQIDIQSDVTIFPSEIFLEIFEYLNYQKLVSIETTCKFFKKIVRCNHFKNQMIKVNKIVLKDVLSTHSFVSFDFGGNKVKDNDIKMLSDLLNEKNLHIKKISLRGSNITGKTLKLLTKCVYLNLIFCDSITDRDLKNLHTSCKTINLFGTKITDKGLKYLSHCEKIELGWCFHITDKGLKNLIRCRVLGLGGCKQITEEGFKNLTNCEIIDLEGSTQITDKHIKNLPKCKELYFNASFRIISKYLKELTKKGYVVHRKSFNVENF